MRGAIRPAAPNPNLFRKASIMKNTLVQRPVRAAMPALVLSLALLLPLFVPATGNGAANANEDTMLFYLIESQRRDKRVCDGTPMPEAQSLIPSAELSDLAAASAESGKSPDAFVQANGLSGVSYLLARVPGNNPRQAFERLLSKQCASIMEPSFRYIGASLHDGEWTLLLSASEPHGAGAQSADAGMDEPILLAASSGSSLPVIPKVPERSRRAPRRPAATEAAQSQEPAAPTAPSAPTTPPAPVVTAPEPAPVTPPSAPAPKTASPAPSVAPEPDPVFAEPTPEPVAPTVTARPRRASSDSGYEAQAKPRRRTKRYDPNLVKDPSPATPYVTKEIIVDSGQPYPFPTDRPVWMVDVPTPGPGPAPVVVSPMPSPPASSLVGAGQVYPGGPVPLYSTQPLGVSSQVYRTEDIGRHGAYPAAINTPWPSQQAMIYTDVPPERTQYPIGSELPRERPDYTPSLPSDRISSPLPMEEQYNFPRALRPRR